MANMASSLFEYKRIKTTHAKAMELRRFVEPLITKAKRGDLHARRQVLRKIKHKDVVSTLFDEIAPAFADRNGGYTRVLKLGFRDNDRAEVSLIELVGLVGKSDTKKGSKAGDEGKEKSSGKRAKKTVAEIVIN